MEFVEVMRQWGRYCKGYTENHNDDCSGCTFEIDGSCSSYAKDNAEYAEQIEKRVMKWAEENLEPQYPTWGEYLASIGVMKPAKPDEAYEVWFTQLYSTPIPADIAQKLGIEPKEG